MDKLRAEHKLLIDAAQDTANDAANDVITIKGDLFNLEGKIASDKTDIENQIQDVDAKLVNRQAQLDDRALEVLGVTAIGETIQTDPTKDDYVEVFTKSEKDRLDYTEQVADLVDTAEVISSNGSSLYVTEMDGQDSSLLAGDADDHKLVTKQYVDEIDEALVEAVNTLKKKKSGGIVKYIDITTGTPKDHFAKLKSHKDNFAKIMFHRDASDVTRLGTVVKAE